MKILYFAIGVIFVYFIIQLIVLPKIRYNNLYNTLKEIAEKNNYHFEVVKNQLYDFIIYTTNKNLYLTYVKVPRNSIITINSLRTWRLSWGGSPSKPGRNFPNQRYLNELSNFLLTKIDDENGQKVVIVYKKTEKVLMYINESELEIVTSKNSPHGLKVIQYNNLEKDFFDLLN